MNIRRIKWVDYRNIFGGENTHGIVAEPQGKIPFGRHRY
jgi:hypothetical protein